MHLSKESHENPMKNPIIITEIPNIVHEKCNHSIISIFTIILCGAQLYFIDPDRSSLKEILLHSPKTEM